MNLCSGGPHPLAAVPPRTYPGPSRSHPEAFSRRGYADRVHLQSSSVSRVTAGAVGFFTLTQFALRPERQLAVWRHAGVDWLAEDLARVLRVVEGVDEVAVGVSGRAPDVVAGQEDDVVVKIEMVPPLHELGGAAAR